MTPAPDTSPAMRPTRTPPGIHSRRLRPEASNQREQAFVDTWAKENSYHDLLALLYSVPANRGDDGAERVYDPMYLEAWAKFPLGDVTERDRIVVATIIQWFGSNCGFDFIRQAVEKCGYTLERCRDKR